MAGRDRAGLLIIHRVDLLADDGLALRAQVNLLRGDDVVNAALALVGELVHRRAAGVGKAEHARGLVKALARRIVTRRAEERKVRVVAHVDDERVAAGHAQRQKRRLKLWER